MISFIKKSGLELLIIFLILLGLFRLYSLKDSVRNLKLTENLPDNIFENNSTNSKDSTKPLTSLNGEFIGVFCSQIEKHFVIADFGNGDGKIAISWKDLKTKKVIAKNDAVLESVMGHITISVENYDGKDTSYAISKIQKYKGRIASFYVGGKKFLAESCQ